MNNITSLVANVKGAGVDGWNSLKTIATFLNYLMHPGLVIHALWNYTLAYSFWICLIVAILATILYAIGFRKCLKFVPLSMIVYSLIKTIGSVL